MPKENKNTDNQSDNNQNVSNQNDNNQNQQEGFERVDESDLRTVQKDNKQDIQKK